MDKKQKELERLSRQLLRFEENSPGSLKKSTLGTIEDLESDTNFFEDASEETTRYPVEWTKPRALRSAEAKLLKLHVELEGPEEEEDEGSEGNSRAPEASVDQDTNMADSSSTDQAAGQSGSNSADQAAGGSSSTDQAAGQSGSNSADQAAGGSSDAADSAAQSENHNWPLFTSKVKDERRWLPIKSECNLYGCDFADIKFRCEIYCKLEKKDATEDQLLDIARQFMNKCPAALVSLGGMYSEAGISSYRSYRDTHTRPRQPNSLNILNGQHEGGSRHDSSLLTDDLDRDRQQVGFGRELRDPPQNWQDIVLARDPDRKEPVEVHGKIQLTIGHWADVSLPSLNPANPTMERHVLVRKADYSENIKNFKKGAEDKNLKMTHEHGDDGASLKDLPRDAVKIMYYTSARQTYVDTWPITYAVGYVIDGPNQRILPWSRGLCGRKWGTPNINDEVNRDRQEVGQDPIVVVPRRRR